MDPTWGLTTNAEDVDALAAIDGGYALSTTGNVVVEGLTAADEDLVSLATSSTGPTTAGEFSLLFDGSDMGLAPRDLTGTSIDGETGTIFGSVLNTWVGGGASGDGDDVFAFDGTTGPATTGSFTIVFDGDAVGFGGEQIDALHVRRDDVPAELGAADLAVTVESDDDLLLPGDEVSLSVTVSNAGPDAAVGTTVQTSLPTGLTPIATVGCVSSSGDGLCRIGTLTAGQSAQITVVAQAQPGTTGLVTTTVEVASPLADPDPSDNSGAVDTLLGTPPTANDDGPSRRLSAGRRLPHRTGWPAQRRRRVVRGPPGQR